MTPELEGRLIIDDIVSTMGDYISLQQDIDPNKLKSAELVSQDIDLKRRINKDNLERVENPQTPEDEELKALIIPALCFYTYARALKMFQGVLTDGGYTLDQDAESIEAAKSVSNDHYATAETYMASVLDFLEDERTPIPEVKNTPQIRVFGGKEIR